MSRARETTGSGAAADPQTRDLARDVRRGLVWSTATSVSMRLGSLVVGMVLARVLAPAEFGVFAVGLTVQAILLTLVDLGLSADLVRAEDPDRRAPTVATMSAGVGGALALFMVLTARPVASLMGVPGAAGVIAVLSISLVVSSAGVVPYAALQRSFRQRGLFACSAVDFLVGTTTTLALVLAGLGPMALAVGRVAAQLSATGLQFVFARQRPRFGFDRAIARSALAYGVPIGLANLLSWALLNIDNVAIARIAGTTALGFYVLAFNVSTWPMSAIGQAVRAVSLAGFAETARAGEDGDLERALSLSWAAALPAGVLLAALAHPLVVVLYGSRWSAATPALAALGIFGALRVAFDIFATYLMAHGAARPVLYVQAGWFAALAVAVVAGTHWMGLKGAAWAHVVVGVGVILPAYLVALSHAGVSAVAILRVMLPPAVAVVPAWWVAHVLATALHQPPLALAAGGAAGLGVYASLTHRWIRRRLPQKPARVGRVPAVERRQAEVAA